tara:strand:- start:597 stop:950 length:354 start_codon:yes stop_codon:yes gene_type:complete
MSRANPFGDLDDFAPQPKARPIRPEAIDSIAQASGFPSRKAQTSLPGLALPDPVAPLPATKLVTRTQRRHTTGRNRQINIKATEDTIATLYRLADERGVPLGALLEQALAALEAERQ